jgi:hypothetical protein
MRRSVFLLLNWFLIVSSLEAADLLANRSPDGRFGLAGDKSTAIEDFQKALATQATTENEYQIAEAELKALSE